MKKPTLFILAAGMGSRYGGLKQMDGLGPNGEAILDYSVFDALRAGFGKIASWRTSAASCSANTPEKWIANSASNRSIKCRPVVPITPSAANHGVRTTPC